MVAKKFYAHDLASAKALVGKPVWVKQGYGNVVYPVQNGTANLSRGRASLLPLERLEIKDVVLRPPPASWNRPAGESELLAIDRKSDIANCSVTSYEHDETLGPRGNLRLKLFNFVAPLEEAGATVTSEPDAKVGAS